MDNNCRCHEHAAFRKRHFCKLSLGQIPLDLRIASSCYVRFHKQENTFYNPSNFSLIFVLNFSLESCFFDSRDKITIGTAQWTRSEGYSYFYINLLLRSDEARMFFIFLRSDWPLFIQGGIPAQPGKYFPYKFFITEWKTSRLKFSLCIVIRHLLFC